MVTFVPGFASQRVADWSTRLNAACAAAAGTDADAQFQAVAAFRAANPLPRATLSDVADHIDHIAQGRRRRLTSASAATTTASPMWCRGSRTSPRIPTCSPS